MRNKKLDIRIKELLIKESDSPIKTWWLSFCDPEKEKGKQFLGVIIVNAKGFCHAHMTTSALKINPGGEIQCWELPNKLIVPDKYLNRLLSMPEIKIMEKELGL